MSKDFGPFEMVKIGGGGMASVHLAVQKSLDRQVVLKILYPHLAEDEKLVARFEREARAAAMMRHENIVQVIDCGVFADQPYIAMEFVEGLDLKAWMELHGAPPLEMALLMLRDICRGLEHAHGHRIVHRDIKPANVMLTPDGTIKIMDFGLARRGEETTSFTVVGSVMGTPAYMSPEQATGAAVDERSDLFSTGVVAYELLGGRRPFQGDSYSSVLHEILNVNPPSLETLNPTVPRTVVGIIHKMLQKDVKRRYQRIAEVRGDLETVIEEMALTRGKDLLHEYVREPERVRDVLLSRRLTRALERGRAYESLGTEKVGEALHEFRCALYVDPGNAEAKVRVKHLEREWKQLEAERERSRPADATMILDPDQAAAIDRAPTPPRGLTPVPRSPLPRADRPSTISTSLPTLGVPGRRSVQRTRTLLLASSGLLLLLVVAVLGVWMWSRSKGETARRPPRARRPRPAVAVGASDARAARGRGGEPRGDQPAPELAS
jgi:serine/threonine protein kinase